MIDRALDEQLLGEEFFQSFEAAASAAAHWLEGHHYLDPAEKADR